jgi:CubicO group peptidase (beta-lactamase class C family)
VRELLGHTSGLSGWEEPLAVQQLADWERCTSLLAAQVPWWDPGTQSGYRRAMWQLASETMPMGPRSCAWGGYGGSLVVNDLDARVTIAYVMNRMEAGLVGDRRGAAIVTAAALALAR